MSQVDSLSGKGLDHSCTKDLDFKCKEPKASQKKSREEMVREPRVHRCPKRLHLKGILE